MLPRRREFGLSGFDSLFDDFFASPLLLERRGKSEFHTDVKVEDNQYVLEMNLPGFKKEAIQVSVENGYVTIEATKSENEEKKQSNGYLIKERYEGSCRRSFYLGDVDEDQIIASFEDGILSVRIPKQAKEIEAKKFIEIQ